MILYDHFCMCWFSLGVFIKITWMVCFHRGCCEADGQSEHTEAWRHLAALGEAIKFGSCWQANATNLPFGDGLYHLFMVI